MPERKPTNDNPQVDKRLLKTVSSSYKKHHFIRNLFLLAITLILLGLIAGGGLFFHYVADSPTITRSAMSSDSSTRIYDSSNHLIAKLGSQNRDYIPYKQIPLQLKNGLISTEDRHFYQGDGVDLARIGEAAVNDLRGNDVQGGSTLTQQLVKLSVFSTDKSNRTLKRKAQEAWLAMKVDHNVPKNKILEYYINKVYMGHNCYGMETASKYYYGKPLKKLTLAESSLIAGMPQSPIQYDPYRFPAAAKNRRAQVINAMLANHKINQAQARQANVAPIQANLINHRHPNVNVIKDEPVIDPYLKQVLREARREGFHLNSGVKIYTNLNMRNQKYMHYIANSSQNRPHFPDNQFQVGAAIVQPNNGKVNAMVGGRHSKAVFGLNRANQETRSTGSVAKPLTAYAPAIQNIGLGSMSKVYDTPFNYSDGTPLKDVDHEYEGAITADKALTESRNIPAVRLLKKVGLGRSARMLKNVGINPGHYSLQNAINLYASPIQVAAAYAPFANGTGKYYQPRTIHKVVDNMGHTHQFYSKPKRVISSGTSYIMAMMLKHAVDNSSGVGSPSIGHIDNAENGGKGGTVAYPNNTKYQGILPDYSCMDAWYTGITPEYVCSVWDGYDTPDEHNHYVSLHEINIPMNYYRYVMQYAESQKGLKHYHWRKPKSVYYSRNKGLRWRK